MNPVDAALATLRRHEAELEALDRARGILRGWAARQGHDRCWWHPDILSALSEVLGVPVPKPELPPRAEFQRCCRVYEETQYGPSPPAPRGDGLYAPTSLRGLIKDRLTEIGG